MVIVDECHHGASTVFESVLNKINSKYVYGVSANDKRIDRLEKKVYMLIGPIRHQFTSKQRIEQQNIDHYVLDKENIKHKLEKHTGLEKVNEEMK